jgi:hypothetical protein
MTGVGVTWCLVLLVAAWLYVCWKIGGKHG